MILACESCGENRRHYERFIGRIGTLEERRELGPVRPCSIPVGGKFIYSKWTEERIENGTRDNLYNLK